MRAGKLDRTITIRRFDDAAIDDYGVPTPNWADVATVRAQLVQQSTEEFIDNRGADDETVMIFRIRYLAGVTTKDQVRHDGRDFNIREVKETGRRKSLELRCVEHAE